MLYGSVNSRIFLVARVAARLGATGEPRSHARLGATGEPRSHARLGATGVPRS